MVRVADQSEAGFAEAQLAAYGVPRFEKACGMSFICVRGCVLGCRTEVIAWRVRSGCMLAAQVRLAAHRFGRAVQVGLAAQARVKQ